MSALQEHGADIIELGMPYSDPLADGPVIQESNSIAIANGMTIHELFQQLKDFRKTIHMPVVLMGYMNPVLQYGFENFCRSASAIGIDGLIIPDLPPYEFENIYKPILEKYNLDFIFLVTPQTEPDRIKKLDTLSAGFLYAVSSSSTTGGITNHSDIHDYLEKLRDLRLKNPVLVGFGIKDKAGFDAVCRFSSGAVIGTAYISALKQNGDVNACTKSFLSSILQGQAF